jgi:hypothetical protein
VAEFLRKGLVETVKEFDDITNVALATQTKLLKQIEILERSTKIIKIISG